MEGIDMNKITTEAERQSAEAKRKEDIVSLGSVMTENEQIAGMSVDMSRESSLTQADTDRESAQKELWKKQAERAKRSRAENGEESKSPENKILVEQVGLDTEAKMKAMKDVTNKVGETLLVKPPEWRKKYAEKSLEMAVKGVETAMDEHEELDESEEFIMKIIQSDKEVMDKIAEALGENGDAEDFIKKGIRVQRDARLNMKL